MRLTLSEAASAIGTSLPAGVAGGDEARGVATDTRSMRPGDLYIALAGERFDGNDFAGRALEIGAAAVVVSRAQPETQAKALIVNDTLVALGQIARAWREKFSIPVIAVTGSIGKTATKELIACALSPLGAVVKTEKNENNEIGLPKTLLRIEADTCAVVVEMGMRGRGQIAYLAGVARPTIGIITRIGESHIELLGSREAIADAKAELFEYLARVAGAAVYNAADDFAERLQEASLGARRVTFADGSGQFAPPSSFRLMDAQRSGDAWTGSAIGPASVRFTLRVRSLARHDLINALGAAAVASVAGVPIPAAAAAIENYRPGAMRLEVLQGRGGAQVLSDCYNAAPASMKSALETLALMDAGGRKLAFLGDMKELGSHAAAMHRDVLDAAKQLGVTELYLVGEEFAAFETAARRTFPTSAEAARFAAEELSLDKTDIVLVKGSRSMAMEQVVNALSETGAPAAE